MKNEIPTIIVMVGLPGSGKSTIVKTVVACAGCVCVSTDEYIDMVVDSHNKAYPTQKPITYNDVFSEYISDATRHMNKMFERAIKAGENVIWDQTNLSRKKRAKILSRVPDGYYKIAHYVNVDEETRQTQLAQRVGKDIPAHVDASMIANLEEPSLDEGFDEIITTIRQKKGD